MKTEFFTVDGMYEHELTEKKSRFIAYLTPASSKKEAEEFFTLIRTRHRDARHNVPAYRVGVDAIEEWSNDDGEPAGTAGKPMLDVLRSSGLTNVALMVTRYFGGTLLGTGGLVRAYGGVTSALIDNITIVKKELHKRLLIKSDYKNIGKIKRLFDECAIFIDMVCAQNVVFTYDVPILQKDTLVKDLVESCAGQVVVLEGDYIYI